MTCPCPTEETFADPPLDTHTSSPSTPTTRKKSFAKKRKAPKGLAQSAKDSTFIDFDSDEEDPVVWERVVKWSLLSLQSVKDRSMSFTDKMVLPNTLLFLVKFYIWWTDKKFFPYMDGL